MKQAVLGLSILLLIGCTVFAEDLYPPNWRYDPGSTYAQWEFLENNVTPLPDNLYNPGLGVPALTVYPTKPWEQEWGGREGVWALSGEIITEIENYPEQNPYKLVQIQITWAYKHDYNPDEPSIVLSALQVTGAPVDSIVLLGSSTDVLEPTGEAGAGPNWNHTTYLFQIRPNPVIETIDITGSIWVDELVIDTICIPEPSTLLILGGGAGIAFLRRYSK